MAHKIESTEVWSILDAWSSNRWKLIFDKNNMIHAYLLKIPDLTV